MNPNIKFFLIQFHFHSFGNPPLTWKISPFINAPSFFEQMHAATEAIYSGFPMLSFGGSPCFQRGPENSVYIKPGANEFILIPSDLNS